MPDLTRDFGTNFVLLQLKRSIRVLLEAQCWTATVVLVYSGMDTMAWLGMPAEQEQVTRRDFIDWTTRYVRFRCQEQLTGEDLYGARCGMVHQYGAESDISRRGRCRLVGYLNECVPEVQFQPSINPNFVLVSVPALADSFFKGVDRFLVDLFADKSKASVAEARVQKITHEYPIDHRSMDVR
jgi:hypothetical protein